MKTLKKALALILSMLIVLAVSPVAFAEESAEDEAEWYSTFGVRNGSGTFEEAVNSVTRGGKVSLLKDVEIENSVEFVREVTVEGNGFMITRNEALTAPMFTVSTGIKLNFENVTLNGNSNNIKGDTDTIIKITNGTVVLKSGTVLGNNSAKGINGGAINASASDSESEALVIMYDGVSITECVADNGAAVYLGNNASMTVYGGTIKDCTALYHGGAIAMGSATASLSMPGGEITGCTASARMGGFSGSAVYVAMGNAAFTGCNIHGNTTNSDLGAIYVTDDANVKVGATAYIYDNFGADADGNSIPSNVFVAEEAKLEVAPEFKEGAKVGISTPEHFVEGQIVNIDFLTYTGIIMGFLYNDADDTTFYVSNGVVNLLNCITVTFDPGNGVCDTKSRLYAVDVDYGWLPTCEEREGFTFLGWYTAGDSLITEDSPVAARTDITLYAKWENHNKLDNSPTSAFGRFFERIGELMRMVFEFLENLFTGGGTDEFEDLEQAY